MKHLISAILFIVCLSAHAGFEEAYPLTAQTEHGHVNHPDDRGGETYDGVARKAHPNWRLWPLIDAEIKRSGRISTRFRARHKNAVKAFYKRHYWDAINADLLGDDELQFQLYDIAVNQGVSTAGKYLQRALNLLNRNQRDYKNVVVDGDIGRGTIKALNAYYIKRANNRLRLGKRIVSIPAKYQLMLWIAHQKNRRYFDLASRHNSQQAFFNGWGNRSIQEYADILFSAGVIR